MQSQHYALPAAGVRSLIAALDLRLGAGTSNRAEDPLHFVTTAYFETPGAAVKISEAYAVHPSLVELATTTDQFVTSQPWVWVERTGQQRFRVPKRELPSVLERTGKPLLARVLVNHRRETFASLGGALSVTVDFELASFAVPRDLWKSELPLIRSDLGAPLSVEANAVVRLNGRQAVPAWLALELARAGGSRIRPQLDGPSCSRS